MPIQIVKNDFPTMGDKLLKTAHMLVLEAVQNIESRAKQDVPIGPTGNLGNSIAASGVSVTAGKVEAEVNVSMEYAAYVNYGTGARGSSSTVPGRGPEIAYSGGWIGMTARPFLSQAAEVVGKEFMAAWQKLEKYL